MGTCPEDTRYAFRVQWRDTQAELLRDYELIYYEHDGTLQMTDLKTHKKFLKRTLVPSVTLNDLYVGNSITVYARQLKVVGFADGFTKQRLGNLQDSTVVVCPPTAYENVGKILDAVHKAKFKVANLKMFRLPRRLAENIFREEQWGPHILDDLASDAFVAFEVMTSDPIVKVKGLIDSNPALFAGAVSSSSARLADQQVLSLFGTANLPNSAQFVDCTVCIVKPHAVAQGVAGQIVDAILSAGFDISAMEQRHLDPQDSAEFLEVYKTVVPEYSKLASELSNGPCIALEVRGENIVNKFREFCGPHSVEVAKALYPTSLRARFGIDRVLNAVHCTDLEEDGVLESQYFFSILPE